MSVPSLDKVASINEKHIANPESQIVLSVTHWTDSLFSFRLSRSDSFRFRSGEFVMIGLPDEQGKLLLRAYSIASPSWDEELEFYSIKVPDGPLTSRLQHIQAGDDVILRPKPVGTLVHNALLPGKRLFLVATGTGIAPFASLLRDPETFERYDEIYLTHTCRQVAELAYSQQLVNDLPQDPLVGEEASKLRYLPTTTQQKSDNMGRITGWIQSEQLTEFFGSTPLNPETDRFMICGSMGLNTDMKTLLSARGFVEGSNSAPGDFAIEKAFVS